MGENGLKIAFLTATDARDKKSRSGSLYYMAQALQRHCGDVYYIGPLSTKIEKLENNQSSIFFCRYIVIEYSAFIRVLLQ